MQGDNEQSLDKKSIEIVREMTGEVYSFESVNAAAKFIAIDYYGNKQKWPSVRKNLFQVVKKERQSTRGFRVVTYNEIRV